MAEKAKANQSDGALTSARSRQMGIVAAKRRAPAGHEVREPLDPLDTSPIAVGGAAGGPGATSGPGAAGAKAAGGKR
jgi:hypothetical protein